MSTYENIKTPSYKMDVDSLVESGEAATLLLAESTGSVATSIAALLAGAERVKDAYLSLGQDHEDLQIRYAESQRERDEACHERDAAIAEVHRLAAMFKKYVDAASSASEIMMTQETRVQAKLEIFKSTNRIGGKAKAEAAKPEVSLPVAQPILVPEIAPAPRAATARPQVRAVEPLAVSPPEASIEEQISAELDRRGDDRAVVELSEHRKPVAVEEPKVPGFLMRRQEEIPMVEESDRTALREAGNAFGLGFLRRKGN